VFGNKHLRLLDEIIFNYGDRVSVYAMRLSLCSTIGRKLTLAS